LEEKVHPFVIKGENRGAATKAEEPREEGKKGAKKIVATPSPDPQHPGNGGDGLRAGEGFWPENDSYFAQLNLTWYTANIRFTSHRQKTTRNRLTRRQKAESGMQADAFCVRPASRYPTVA
jgi:hypothetical protein